MTAIKTKAARARRTKAEIQEEFDLIAKESVQGVAERNEKAEEALKEKEIAIREAVKDIDADAIVRKITELNLEVSKNFNAVSEKLVAEVNLLSQLRQAVALETAELNRLHKKDISITAIDQLVDEYTARKKGWEQEIVSLEEQYETLRKRQEQENKEFEETLKKTRQREADEYNYKIVLEKKKAQDKYEEEMRLRLKENQEKQEVLEKQWKDREAILKVQENEVLELRKQVEEFPAKLKLELDKATAEAIKQTKVQYTEELLSMKYSSETEKRLAELKTRTLEEAVTQYMNQIQLLQKQTEEAKKQVQDIAVKAIEGASGAKALNHVSQIAMEQAKIK